MAQYKSPAYGLGCKTKSLLSLIVWLLTLLTCWDLKWLADYWKKKANLFTHQTLSSKSRVKCFRIYSNERFSCRFHFLLQAFFVLLVSFFYSVILFFFVWWPFEMFLSFSQALRWGSTAQPSFAWCIFLLIISYYWTNIINLPNVTSQHKLVVFIYFKWFFSLSDQWLRKHTKMDTVNTMAID